MFEQDYIMRLIRELVRTILKLSFNIETESPSAELLENKEEKELLGRLLDLVDSGNINEAEGQLRNYTGGNSGGLMVELLFYSYLNDKTDEFLDSAGFSREKVKSGIDQVTDKYGLGGIAQMFLSDL